MKLYTDGQLEAKIEELHSAIKSWAESKDLWHDCGFQTFLSYVDAEPESPAVVTILHFDGSLQQVFNGTFDDGSQNEFDEILKKHGYEYELYDYVSLYIYACDPTLSKAFESYFHWQWVCSLIEPDCSDVYEELYSYFANRPDDLHRIGWRDFEILLFRIFQNQGFQAELGLGRGDGGVDIRLLQRDPLGDILTLVQAKKYASKNKITLTEVAALYGITKVEHARKGIFVTTSEYLPGVKKWAGRVTDELDLYTSSDIAEWCKNASDGIVADKSKLVSKLQLHRLIEGLNRNHDSRILHAHTGCTINTNAFALVLKETKYAALIMALPKFIVSHDGYGQRGCEAPVLDDRVYKMLSSQSVWRVKRRVGTAGVSYWDGSNLYSQWNGQPVYFDLMD